MVREIKFRFWHKDSKQWEKDLLLSSAYYQNPFSRSDIIVCQWTGLLDKSGKEIYEGDLLKVYYTMYVYDRKTMRGHIEPHSDFNVCEVYCEPAMWLIRGYGKNKLSGHLVTIYTNANELTECGLEIIGNIYESPELLTKGKSNAR